MTSSSDLKIDLRALACQSGATDENGSCAKGIFCFTEQELVTFSQKLAQECRTLILAEAHRRRNDFMGDEPPTLVLTGAIDKAFGLS